MKKYFLFTLFSLSLFTCDNNNNAINNVIQYDNRFHILKARYPQFKTAELHMKTSTVDGSLSLWEVIEGSNPNGKNSHKHVILTPNLETDIIKEWESYTTVQFIGKVLYAKRLFELNLKIWDFKKEENKIKNFLSKDNFFSAIYAQEDSNELYLAHSDGKIQSYSIDTGDQKEEWQFKLESCCDFIQQMVRIGNCFIAQIQLKGIYHLDLETKTSREIISKFHPKKFIISSTNRYLITLFKDKRPFEVAYEEWIPRPNRLEIFNLEKTGLKRRPILEWDIIDEADEIKKYSFLPNQEDLFLVLHKNNACSLYSLSQKSKIAHIDYMDIFSSERITHFLFPSTDEIVLKCDNTKALIINLPNLMSYENHSNNDAMPKKEIIIKKNYNNGWNVVVQSN